MTYSHKDFTGRNLTERKDMNGLTITGSCFSQEIPDSIVFPEDMHDVTFINCNLDNCYIPPFGNVINGGSARRYKIQNDLNTWEIDENDIPTTVVDCDYFYKFKLMHPHPKDIPEKLVEKRIDYRDTDRNARAG